MERETLFRVSLALNAGEGGKQQFDKYKAVDAYQTGSGILVLPRYSSEGKLCEVVLEKEHYSENSIDLASTISHDKMIAAVNDIAPVSERGRSTMPFGTEYLSQYSGNTVTTFSDYEAISIQIYGRTSPAFDAGDIAARINWNKRPCK